MLLGLLGAGGDAEDVRVAVDVELRRLAGDRLVESELRRFGDVRGIRIEDDVLVTADGAEVLTRAIPKEPPEVERSIGAAGAPG